MASPGYVFGYYTARRVVLSVLAFVASLLAVPIHSAREVAHNFDRLLDWPEAKFDAAVSLVLDRLNRYLASLELGDRMRRAKAFLERALGHDDFAGDGFRQPV